MLLVHTLHFEYQGPRHLVNAEEHQEGSDVVREIWYRTPLTRVEWSDTDLEEDCKGQRYIIKGEPEQVWGMV